MSEVQSATMEYGPEIFANNFWGKDEAGYEVLTARLKQAKRTCEEIKAMYHERAMIEEEYAKRLSRLSKFPLGKDETGALRDALEVTRLEMEESAKSHMNLSQKMRTGLEQNLSDFITKQKEKRKSQQAVAERSLRNKQGHATLMQKAKEKYEAECIKITGLLSSRVSVIGKELEKLNMKIEKTQMSARTADQEYMQMVKTLAEATEKWNYDWRVSCDKFQDIEEERIDYLKRSLWDYTNHISTVCVADDESCERIRVSLEKCDVNEEIFIFIKERATGPEIPEPPTYVNFYADQKEGGSRFKRASFDKFTTYADRRIEETELEVAQDIAPNQQPPENNGIRYPHSTHALYNYLPEESISHYINKMSERASLYANTSSASRPGTIKQHHPRIADEPIEEEQGEPIDPRQKQMLSIGSNVLEVQTGVENTSDSVEGADNTIEKAIDKLEEVAIQETVSREAVVQETVSREAVVQETVSREAVVQETTVSPPISDIAHNESEQTAKVTKNSDSDSEKLDPHSLVKPLPMIPDEQSSQQVDSSNNLNLEESKSEPLPVPQQNVQPTESNSVQLQQISQANSSSPAVFQQRFDQRSASTYSSYQQLPVAPSVVSSTQSLKPQPVEGPGDLRRQSSTDNGPVSSQQQQIQENLAMRQSSISLRLPNPQGPGDLRRTSSNSSELSLRQFQLMSTQYNSPTIVGQQEQTIPFLNQQRNSPNPQLGSLANINNSIGINLDPDGRVVKDVLAEEYVANDGKLPSINYNQPQQRPPPPNKPVYNSYVPLQNNPTNYPVGQVRPIGRPPIMGGYTTSPMNVPPQSSFRGAPNITRSNTINSGNMRPHSPYSFDPHNRRTTLHGPVNPQQFPSQQPSDFKNPNFYTNPTVPPSEYRPMPNLYASNSMRNPHTTREQKVQRTDDGRAIRFYVRTLYDYVTTQPDEISFTAGDIIAVLNTSADGWWEGEILDERRKDRGIFPCNYTEVLNDWIS
ncbi:5191_t:CDS:10 [Acaulospora morrowiae]|uniref:5191_t:CDS:1 n=1 Tax=Acaulospora morrowiae TaxID=94023 RepID=A0A9N8ZVF2_9GLOM|nr:5191_t:CDS:10 [Acaulospora morrowiae]